MGIFWKATDKYLYLKRDLGGMGLNNLAAEVAIRKALDLISHGTDSKELGLKKIRPN